MNAQTLTDTITADIEERGNGFPGIGDYVPGTDGGLYRVVMDGRTIDTRHRGGNRCLGYEIEAVDWSECPDGGEHYSMAIVGAHPMDD